MNQKLKRFRQILVAIMLIAAVEGFSSCEKYSYTEPKVNPNTVWHFSTDIQPIFNSNCITCHNGTQFPDLRSGKSFAALTKAGLITSPGESSGLYVQITTQRDHISRTTSIEKDKILNWINQGALNN
jgi:hypothetical protein